MTIETVDRQQCATIEPALKGTLDKVGGGLFAPADGAGDALLFTRNLAKLCEAKGVSVRLGTTITKIRREADRITHVVTDKGELIADYFVLALGLQSPTHARTLHINLPIYPIKGYTATVSTDGYADAPSVGIIEEDNLVAFARLGNRLRVGGKAASLVTTSTTPHTNSRVYSKLQRIYFHEVAIMSILSTMHACALLRPGGHLSLARRSTVISISMSDTVPPDGPKLAARVAWSPTLWSVASPRSTWKA